jgi:hypothetical protein
MKEISPKKSSVLREAIIDGKKAIWHACSTRDNKAAIADYPEMKYIGSGFIYFINGVETKSEKEHHFFIHISK